MAAPAKPIVVDPGEAALAAAQELVRLTEVEAATTRENMPADILTKHYLILTDGIVAGDEKQALGISVLTGVVTRADIENSGADFEWLLRSGAIEEAGYR